VRESSARRNEERTKSCGNGVGLYDLKNDPNEMRNLAVDRRANGDLLLAMNQKLNDVIAAEVGEDNGDFLPENKTGWVLTRLDP
jgi:hypothetical protein